MTAFSFFITFYLLFMSASETEQAKIALAGHECDHMSDPIDPAKSAKTTFTVISPLISYNNRSESKPSKLSKSSRCFALFIAFLSGSYSKIIDLMYIH